LIDTVTDAFAPAASVPPEDDRVTHDCVFPALQFIGALPGFDRVYAWLAGLNGPPAVPEEDRLVPGDTDSEPAVGAAVTVTENAFVAVPPPVTWTVKFEVPAVVGVPDSTPPEERVSPAGSVPADTDQLYGTAPPVAANVWLYGVPTVPGGSEAVVIVGAAGADTVMVIAGALTSPWLPAFRFPVSYEFPNQAAA
jgi:hypothetical protein